MVWKSRSPTRYRNSKTTEPVVISPSCRAVAGQRLFSLSFPYPIGCPRYFMPGLASTVNDLPHFCRILVNDSFITVRVKVVFTYALPGYSPVFVGTTRRRAVWHVYCLSRNKPMRAVGDWVWSTPRIPNPDSRVCDANI